MEITIHGKMVFILKQGSDLYSIKNVSVQHWLDWLDWICLTTTHVLQDILAVLLFNTGQTWVAKFVQFSGCWLISPWNVEVIFIEFYFQTHLKNWYLEVFLWNWFSVSITEINRTDYKSTLVQVMAWSPCDITWPQWVKWENVMMLK